MSSTGPLHLAIELESAHRLADSGSHQIIPVVDSELTLNHEVYDATIRRFGGTYLAVDRMSEPRVAGTVEVALASVLKAAMRASPLALAIEILQDGPSVVVRRADGVVPANESELLILAFVSALFHEQLASHAFAAISWSEERLDEIAQETLWELIRVHLAARQIGSLRTLVLIAGGQVNSDIHCEKEPSIRFALRAAGLSKRKGPTSLGTIVNKLVRDGAGPFVFFLGAGASATAQMPLGNAVRDYALERFFGDKAPPPVSELARRFYDWVRENDRLLADEDRMDALEFVSRLTLERVLREEFRREGREASPTLKHLLEQNANAISRKKTRSRRGLRAILDNANKVMIVTVNFDTILEDEFGDAIRVFASPTEFDDAPDYVAKYIARSTTVVPVLKLHGSLAAPTTIVADVDTRSLGLSGGAIEALHVMRKSRDDLTPWVYIGASMRDPDITQVIGGSDFADGLDEWWVSPLPDPAVGRFVDEHRNASWLKKERAGLWERQVTETADKFLTQLAGAWPSVR